VDFTDVLAITIMVRAILNEGQTSALSGPAYVIARTREQLVGALAPVLFRCEAPHGFGDRR
jgi:hypothetical protein